MPSALLLTTLTLGAVGLYLLMPGGRMSMWRAALVVLAGAVAGIITLTVPLFGGHASSIWFGLLSVIGFWGAVGVITHVKPVYNALHFTLVIICVAGLMLLQQAEFAAMALVIIYGGAILVTYVFVIMLAQQSGGPGPADRRAREPFWGVLAGFGLLGALTTRLALGGQEFASQPVRELTLTQVGTVENTGILLLTEYMVGVNIAAVLLLAAMVGAVAIARRKAADLAAGEVE